jgi:hypothetical protein
MGQDLPSSAENIINFMDTSVQHHPITAQYDVILCRFALSIQHDPYAYLSGLMPHLNPQGIIIIQDYVLPDEERVADYINGFIHIFNKKHVQSFAQYMWDGLLLDVGVNIQAYHYRPIKITIQQWIEHYQTSGLDTQHAQVMLIQAPDAVVNIMQLHYEGTPYAEFELQEIVCIVQREL